MQEPPCHVLELKDVTVKLGGTPIVEDVNLMLEAGALALLIGPNGAGKSTLLRAVVNLLPSSGDIEICGFHPASLEARARFIFVPDEAALYEDLTLAEHVRFLVMIYRQEEAEARILYWLERFHLLGKLEEFPSTHSRGMRQKLALALALGIHTPLLVLDEPYNGLDAEAQERLSRALQERAKGGGTVLLTGHQLELENLLAARLLTLQDGALLAPSLEPAL